MDLHLLAEITIQPLFTGTIFISMEAMMEISG
jgi:hypothetical protein